MVDIYDGNSIIFRLGIMGKETNKGSRPLRKKRHGELTHIREVVDAIFSAPHCPIDFKDIKIWRLWDEAVGKQIADHAQPSSIKEGILVVKVSNSVWLQELEFRTHEIRERINRALQREAVQKIRFRVGEAKGRPSEE